MRLPSENMLDNEFNNIVCPLKKKDSSSNIFFTIKKKGGNVKFTSVEMLYRVAFNF